MKNEATERYFEKRLQEEAKMNKAFLNQRVFDTIDRFLRLKASQPLAGKLLDIGCGDGSFVSYCNDHGLQAQGVDINDGIDLESDPLPYPSGSFDIVVMLSVLEHLQNPSNAMNEIRRILARGGIFVVITPNLDTTKFHFWDDPTHVRPYNPRNILVFMRMFDFSTIAVSLWTVGKPSVMWRMPACLQFWYGRLLPFAGLNRYAPSFLKGKSTTMLCAFRAER